MKRRVMFLVLMSVIVAGCAADPNPLVDHTATVGTAGF
jgi:hypothetical protein